MKISKNMIKKLSSSGIDLDQYCLNIKSVNHLENKLDTNMVDRFGKMKTRSKDEEVALQDLRAMVQEGYSLEENSNQYIINMDVKHRLKKFISVFNIGKFKDNDRMSSFVTYLLTKIPTMNHGAIEGNLIGRILKQKKRNSYYGKDLMKAIDLLPEEELQDLNDHCNVQVDLNRYYDEIIGKYGVIAI